jgi:hypothetical protein
MISTADDHLRTFTLGDDTSPQSPMDSWRPKKVGRPEGVIKFEVV